MASKKTIIAGLASLLALFGLQAYAASTTVSVNFGSSLSSMPAYGLGVGCSVYDYGMTGSGSAPAVTNAGAMAIRYPGGSFADIYHWQTGTACDGGYVAPGTGFDNFMTNLVNRAGAKAIITCNYGSDPTCSTGASPSEAAAWVQYANVTKGYGIKYWEIGNEQAGNGYYGSSYDWEEDLHTDKSPMAYGSNVVTFSSAMKAFDSTIKIGASVVTPGSYPDTDAAHPYNKCVLTNCASAVDFVIIHWYPNGTPAQSLQSPTQIPGVASSMRSEINSYVGARASSVAILVTETGPGTNNGPAAALYTADTYMAWIENGAQNVDFQELHQGFLAEGDSGVADNAPIWGAYGCRMARNLASVGDTFVTASSGTTMVGVHAVKKTNGHYGVMLINRDPTNSYTITVNANSAALASSGTRYDFGAANFGSSIYPSSGPTQSTITGIGSSSFSITIPAYTMSVVDIPAGSSATDLAQFNFEASVQGWTGGGGIVSGVATSTAQYFAGNQSLAVNFNSTTNGTGSPSVGNVAINPATTITFHVWIPSGSTVTALQPFLMDQNWMWTSSWYGSFTANAWNTLTLTVPTNAVTPLNALGVQFVTSAGMTNTCYLDSITWNTPPPAAPQNLTATPGDANVALAWSAASNATAYYVKSSNVSSNFTTIATNLTLTFTNTGLSNGTLYYFAVSALNGAGESTNSAPVSERPTSSVSVAMNAVNAGGQLQISWPADQTGWQLQSQTNNLTSGLGTNWVNVPASMQTNQMTVPLNSANGSVFFRLVKP